MQHMKFVSASEMQQIDQQAIQDYGIPSIILMENAGIACADEVVRFVRQKKAQIAIFSGKGNNGGDGFVAARHLYNRDLKPVVFFFQKPSEMKPDPLTNFKILQKMKVELIDCSNEIDWNQVSQTLERSKVIVDALFGTGLSKPIEDLYKTVIQLMNESKAPVVAVDIPSGLHADTGEAMGICVRAKSTVTFGFPKKAFLVKSTRRYTGRVVVADISIPRGLR